MTKEEIEKLKKLKEITKAPLGICKEALEKNNWNLELAQKYLLERGKNLLAKKAEKLAGYGIIEGYIHFNGRVGALVELRAETDFVTRSPEFKSLAHEIALQVATMSPLYLDIESIPEDTIKQKKEELASTIETENEKEKSKILEAKLNKWFEDVCLLQQKYFKNESLKIKDLIDEAINKFGEKIEVRRFVRLSIND